MLLIDWHFQRYFFFALSIISCEATFSMHLSLLRRCLGRERNLCFEHAFIFELYKIIAFSFICRLCSYILPHLSDPGARKLHLRGR